MCRRGTAPSSLVYPLYPNTPFCRAAFYLYLAGDWQLTFCTGGNFWERGQCQWVSCISPSFWDPLYTFMYLSSYLFIPTTIQRHTPPLLSAFSPSLVLFSGMNNWPGFNFLSFPATANWKTPLKCLLLAKNDPTPTPSLSLSVPFFQGEKADPGPSDRLVWAICRWDSSVSISGCWWCLLKQSCQVKVYVVWGYVSVPQSHIFLENDGEHHLKSMFLLTEGECLYVFIGKLVLFQMLLTVHFKSTRFRVIII